MSRRKFSHLLEKYQRGECNAMEKKFVEYWYGLIETEGSANEKDVDWDNLEEKMWHEMQTKMRSGAGPQSTSVFKMSALRWLSAASLILFASYLLFNRLASDAWPGLPITNENGWVVRENHSSQPSKVNLGDGSVIELWPDSKVTFQDQFAPNERVVRLTGKAFFSVKRDVKRPFFVKSGQIVTRVLGTSFYVEEGSSLRSPKVAVVTGTVAVYETPKSGNRHADNIILKPNQEATFYASQHKFVQGLVDVPKLIDPDMNLSLFRFRNAPLSDVVEILRNAYGIEIVVENKDMRNCTLTADLTGQPLYTQLEIICVAVAGKYQVKNTTIFVGGTGCTNNSVFKKST